MPSAEIITIGSEILLGEIDDRNAGHLARSLRGLGFELRRINSVGDRVEEIAALLREAAGRSGLVITTGGLGPTVDDPTREAFARATEQPLEFEPALWAQIEAYFARIGRRPSDNNRRQAFLPRGALAIENPVGTAPGFIVERGGAVLVALPGVPREMHHLLETAVLPWLAGRFAPLDRISVRVLHTAGLGESAIDGRIGDLEALENPVVGLAAHSGRVDLRISAWAASDEAAQALVAPVEAELRRRLGGAIYGADGETLGDAVLAALAARGWRLALAEAGLEGRLAAALAEAAGRRAARAGGGAAEASPYALGLVLPGAPEAQTLLDRLAAIASPPEVPATLAASLRPASACPVEDLAKLPPGTGGTVPVLELRLVSPEGRWRELHAHVGHPGLAAARSGNLVLQRLRSLIGERGAEEG